MFVLPVSILVAYEIFAYAIALYRIVSHAYVTLNKQKGTQFHSRI